MPKGDVETFHEGGAWHNKVEGTGEVLGSSCPTKTEAQAAGREYARAHKVEHIIRNLDGRIGERNTYGHDPPQYPRLTHHPSTPRSRCQAGNSGRVGVVGDVVPSGA